MSVEFPRAGFWRRFASLIYDSLVVISLSMLTAILYFAAIQSLIALGFIPQTEDPAALIQDSPLLYGMRSTLFIGVNIVFFAYFWTKSGQTIGMRAWRLKVQTRDGNLITWPQAIIRSVAALLGLGNLVVLVDFKNKRALQDYISKTDVVALTKEENKRIYRSLD
ncbi:MULTISPECIES: RDD family protein [unclassified Pseudoalteromonas]|uniref:RDD family protein n=1 Tax=unclassified Pseudoalteromonas TaxID=194690 RepID=UPI0025B43570|nr:MULTISPECIES: RDD family protein [unclassified Pseudoalteromonas]MDN3380935.1 RDD family protein [Pseudoalteromonas sp. APC 3893]MDN3389342.1 RDD family protein [Pseudoalteromonas sp. APC 4017]